MSNPTQIHNYDCPAAIAAYRITKFGAADHSAAQASADTDALMGVADRLGGEAGGRVDVVKAGLADVEYGAAVTRGELLMADADGKAIPATTGKTTIGQAEVSGVSGDIGLVNVIPGEKI